MRLLPASSDPIFSPGMQRISHCPPAPTGSPRSIPGLALALVLIGTALTGCSAPGTESSTATAPLLLRYPYTAVTNVVDLYHDVRVADPYRWLEDDLSPATAAWVEAQNQVTFGYLNSIPERYPIRQRLIELWNYERFGIPVRRGDRYFFTQNDGLQNQSVLYTTRRFDEAPAVLLDPNQLAADGTVALTGFSVSDDGRWLAYGLATAGSDWQEWRVREVDTGADQPEVLRWVKFSGAAWTRDGAGFFYSRYDEPASGEQFRGVNYYQKLYYHRRGTAQAEDRLVYHRPDQREWGFRGQVTEDGRYLVITVTHGTEPRNRVFYQDLQVAEGPVVELLRDADASYRFVDNDGPMFYFHTDNAAPRGRLVAVDLAQPSPEAWREVVPEGPHSVQTITRVGGRFCVAYLRDAASLVRVFRTSGEALPDVDLPALGAASGFEGQNHHTETFYAFTGFTRPTAIFRFDLNTGRSEPLRAPRLQFNPEDYETRQEFFRSKDGTRIPMFLTHRKGLPLDGNRPTLLYGYGGFKISLTPNFTVANMVWLEMGGVLAIPNLRGGGEYGEAWYRAGTKLQKQNVFDDFIAAAEWLVLHNYTNARRLAIAGGSNGGLLVGACMTQRPGLFAAALPAVGVLDMLRFHRFTIGWAWTSDYGCADQPEEFKALFAYSPYHNLKPGTAYPATLITTADHDDRVVPAHSFKFAAALQAAQSGPNPVLIRIETRAGHGAGKPVSKVLEETVDRWAFLVRALRMELPEAFVAGSDAGP